MGGPGEANEDPHQQGDGQAVARVVDEADGQEPEHERPRRAPQPEVLVQRVENGDGQNEEGPGHGVIQAVAPATVKGGLVNRCVGAALDGLGAFGLAYHGGGASGVRGMIRSGVVTIAVALATSGSTADWPGYRGPKRDAHSMEEGLLAEWPNSGPPLAWKVLIKSRPLPVVG